ncbi:MAG: hypothetical protein IT267_09520 [Saprospiraceae bacterium]|nr:hypothetical protein [Saprospiraceae bacterium]
MLNRFIFLLLLFIANCTTAQVLPRTDLYYIQLSNDQQWKVEKIEFLNSFNFNSYNNQPFFINDFEILCTAKLNSVTNTDIYKMNLKDHILENVIDNPANDYSPRLVPEISDGIFCVHINPNDTIQYLVNYDTLPDQTYKIQLQNPGQVGYFRYFDRNSWICFLVDQPNNLLAVSSNKSNKIFASNIGRTFEITSAKEVLFVQKSDSKLNLLKAYNPSTGKMSIIAEMPENSEDFVIQNNNSVLCSSGSRLLQYSYEKNMWKVLLDLSKYNLHHIGRFALRKNRLVLVNEVKD